MPVINPLWTAAMRRQWPLVGAVILFLFFTLAHMLAFEPTVARYQRAVSRADKLGIPVDPLEHSQVVPPRVFALLAENAMPAADARREGDSGALGAAMLEEMTRLAGRAGLEVLVTEPGPVIQSANSVHVRAHMRVSGTYSEFVAFLRSLAQNERLYGVDRFTLQAGEGGGQLIDVWVSRYLIKHSGVTN
jgi:hypothetical protein